MSAALTLAALADYGAELRAEPEGLRVRGPRPLPGELRAMVRRVAPLLLRVASGRWREDLARWPPELRADWAERAAIMAIDGGLPPDLAERAAYVDLAASVPSSSFTNSTPALQLDPGEASGAEAPPSAPLAPFLWASVVPLSPLPAPLPPGWRFPHPLDGPPAAPAPPLAPLEQAPLASGAGFSPELAALHGYFRLPCGCFEEADRAPQHRCGRGDGRDGRRWRGDLPEHERQVLRQAAREAIRSLPPMAPRPSGEASGRARAGESLPPDIDPSDPMALELLATP